ncbi:LAETG motif-containing sortase-dependent surface protein [Streptomyces sp. NPDC012403]|uniref:LAETG motif-containing sortase-dependent surface protein n=1 Tax=Streptomyces sp. NPDC012403 TaxID=3364831 RepID=UPI0036E7FA89
MRHRTGGSERAGPSASPRPLTAATRKYSLPNASNGEHLDRDGDGISCDKPPADFKPHEETESDTGTGTGTGTESTGNTGSDSKEQGGGTDLAETGGSNATPYIAAGGAAVVLLGGGVMIAARRRRGDSD